MGREKGFSWHVLATRRGFSQARYPIEVLFGPNVAKETASAEIEQALRDRVNEVLPERLAHEIGRLWSRKSGGDGN